VDVIERIKSQLSASPVVPLHEGHSRFSSMRLFGGRRAGAASLGNQFSHVNIFEDPEVREALKRYSNWPTYPQLYVKGELIGGADIITDMHQKESCKTC